MIVKKEHIGSRLSTRQIAKLLGGLGIVLLLFLLLNIIIAFIPREDKMIVCDAETIALNGVNPDFIQGGYIFLNGNSRSSEFARSGRYSSKVEPKNKYGITHILKGARAGEQYVVSVWRMGNRLTEAHLAFSIDNGKLLHKEANLPVEFEPEGWEKLVLNVAIPYDYKGEEIKIYVYTNGKAPAYFDDLQIRRLDRQERIDSRIVYDTAFQHLNLQIDDKGMKQLDLKRKEALREFVLFTDDDDWVTGRISQESKEPVPVKLRLKGDQPDHFKTGQYSFRVKVKSPHAWNRMLTFSLHSSKARYHLAEWVYHKWMQAEDILTTRYDFLTLSLNKELLGVYAYEEHFEKQLVEFKSRREGPIVKFDEDAVWKAGARQSRLGLEKTMMGVELNSFEGSEVQPFGESKILSSPVLAEQFKLAKNLMTQYQMGTKPASEVFDIDRLAKYYAIIDITEAYHSTIWHNQRFYYNPVTGRLEPIAFDGFTDLGPFNYNNKLLLGMDMRGLTGDFQRDLHARLFMDREFVEKYNHYLFAFTEPSYLDLFFQSIDSALVRREEFIQKEFKGYTYDKEGVQNRARNIHALLPAVDNGSLRAYLEGEQDGELLLKAANYHPLPLEIIGYGSSPDRMGTQLENPVFLPAFQKQSQLYLAEANAPLNTKVVFFRVPGLEDVYHTRLSPWETAGESTPVQKLFKNINLTSNEVFQVAEPVILFNPGKHRVDHDIIIPEGYTVEFPAGTQLDLVNKAKFISRSPVFMMGESENPILIQSSDHTANGFTVMETNEQSKMSWVRFEHLNTLNYEGWQLTGAVTFYEAEVDIRHCAFLRNHCEDGLNIIRSEFSMAESLVGETAFDGFDADFCNGRVINCRFVDLGNDGMDFSGSRITVVDCEVENAGDKGLSVGEESDVQATNLTVNKAVTGVASKDLSYLKIDRLELTACQTGLAAYQKKPEYGGAKIYIGDLVEKDVKYLHLIENGSLLNIKGKEVRSN